MGRLGVEPSSADFQTAAITGPAHDPCSSEIPWSPHPESNRNPLFTSQVLYLMSFEGIAALAGGIEPNLTIG